MEIGLVAPGVAVALRGEHPVRECFAPIDWTGDSDRDFVRVIRASGKTDFAPARELRLLRDAVDLTAEGRTVRADAEPEKGFYYRSDHFEFAKQGVPALDPDAGTEFTGKPANYGMQKRDEYTANDYHKPSDEIKPDWDLSGAVEDAQMFFEVGYRVAQSKTWPEWKPGTEFKAKREAMLQKQ